MIENLVNISADTLLSQVQQMSYEDYRFVTATCVSNGDNTFDIIYHFDKNLDMVSYRIKVDKDEEIQSISKIYFCALLVENEMKELFGVKIKGIAVDYGGHMLLSDEELNAPMAKHQIVIEKKGANDNG